MISRSCSRVIVYLLALLLLPGLSSAQDLGGRLITTSPDASIKPKLHKQTIVRAALSNPIDMQVVYSRLDNLRGDQGMVTRGAREEQIYDSLSPAVVLVFTKEGFGSGSLIDPSGAILTNWHVVEDYTTVGVIFKPKYEGTPISFDSAIIADVIRIDEVADLALLRVRDMPIGVSPIPLGVIDEVKVGADVHAIGHPTGESWTYTRGFISQYRKDYEWAYDDVLNHKADVVQTQTPINPGNSGGPLISSSGRLLGVNSFKSEGEALNFAVSINEVRRFLNMKSDRLAARNKPRNPEPTIVCSDEPTESFRGKDGASTVSLYDLDCDGVVDVSYTEPDDPNKPVYVSMDTSENGQIDTLLIDVDRDGDVDYSLIDVSGNGEPDLRGHYRDGADEPYWLEKLT